MFFIIIGADVWQRAYAAKSVKIMRKGFVLAASLLIIIGLLACFIGISAKNKLPGLNPNDVLVAGFSNLLSPGLLGFGLVILFAAIMSTSDTLIFVAAMSLSNDLIPRFGKILKEQLVRITKWAIFFVSISGIILAILIQDIINFAFIFTASILVLAPIIIYSHFKELKNDTVIYSLIATPVSVLVVTIKTGIKEELSIISLIVAVISLFIGQRVFK
jgi:SSS family solute:Na+ symporter